MNRNTNNQRTFTKSVVFLCACLFPFVCIHRAFAQLTADQCALLYNSTSEKSQSLAQYYAKVRGVPSNQLIGIALPKRESISRETYDSCATKVRSKIQSAEWGERVKCLITFYDIPLKVSAPKATPASRSMQSELELILEQSTKRLKGRMDEFEQKFFGHTPGGAAGKPDQPGTQGRQNSKLWKQYERYQGIKKRAIMKVNEPSNEDRTKLLSMLVTFMELAEGKTSVLPFYSSNIEKMLPDRAAQLQTLLEESKRVEGELAKAYRAGPLHPDATEALPAVRTWQGLLGLSFWVDDQARWLGGNYNHAAFDNELTLVLLEQYPLYEWVPNAYYLFADQKSIDRLLPKGRTLMISRIDGPTPEIARRLIDDSIEAERAGLMGKCYIDLRAANKNDLYREYDRDLQFLSVLVKENTNIPVRLNAEKAVFKPGSCDDVAIYCGWYSVGNYVPAFAFNKGAFAYHIASFELKSLRGANNSYWCAGLLRDGAASTLGPTAEPYLSSFPKPSHLIGLMLTGKLTLVECYFATLPFNSWQLALIGDPLYTPFKNNPKLKWADLTSIPGFVPTQIPTVFTPEQPSEPASVPPPP